MHPQPQPAERIDSLDILRGVAVLGILVMNIQAFAMVPAAYVNPTVAGPMEGLDFVLWAVAHIGFENKFLSIFSALFGAGLLMMHDRGAADANRLHYRRMAGLALIGAVHAYGIWFGDILFIYAVIGLIAFAFREIPPRRLLVIAAVLYLIPLAYVALVTAMLHAMPTDEYGELVRTYWQPTPAAIAEIEAAYRGSWLEQMGERVPQALQIHLGLLPTKWGWRVLALMLAGMAGYRLGVLTGQWSAAGYRRLAVTGFSVGLPISAAGVVFNQVTGWEMATSLYLGAEFNALAAPFVAAGWIGGVLWVWKTGLVPRLAARLRAVGRTALTCYLLTSVLCTFVFYGHGLGWFGEVGRLGQYGVVVVVWAVLLTAAPAWLRHFRMGPVEWLWRWATYGVRAPLRRA